MQIAIVLYPGMTALDAIGPYEVLHLVPGAEVRFVWRAPGPIVTDSGVLVLGATHSFDETPRPDVVLVPGSSASTAATMRDPELLAWLRATHEHTRWTTSVCSGALILAAAGLLDGQPATSHWAALPFLRAFGVEARPDDRIVRAGKLWTAAGVSAGIDLALALAAEITDADTARVIQLLIEYDPRPPFDAGHVSKASAPIRARAEREMLQASLSPREALAMPLAVAQHWARALRGLARKTARSTA